MADLWVYVATSMFLVPILKFIVDVFIMITNVLVCYLLTNVK